MDYEKVLKVLQKASFFDNVHFEVDGVECHVGKYLFPTNVYSAGVRGYSATIYPEGSLNGVIGSAYVPTYTGESPTAEQLAQCICDCAKRKVAIPFA